MRSLWRHTTMLALMLLSSIAMAQESSDPIFKREEYIIFKDLNVDWDGEEQTEVNKSKVSKHYDLYSDLLLYTRSPIDINRQGLNSWVFDQLYNNNIESIKPPSAVAQRSKIRLSGSMERYNIALRGEHSSDLNRSNSITTSLDLRTGRDLFVDGLFSNQARGYISWIHKLSGDDYLETSLYIPYINEAQRGWVNDETASLTANTLYNSAWGYYDGEERSGIIVSYAIPKLQSRYQKQLSSSTTLASEMTARYGVSSRSQLGWYDGYNPYPDYYRNLPSYIQNEQNNTTIEQAWRSGDSDYTQINWDNMIWSNQRSEDGESHYVMERRVSRIAEVGIDLMASSRLSQRFTLSYGVGGEYNSSRSYKRLDDLLGGDYLNNTDQYIGDYESLDIDMDNDLHNPDRQVECGDRFGYDYTLSTVEYSLLLALNYTHNRVSIDIDGEFGSSIARRVGHYERERFAGGLSYGASSSVELPQNRLSYRAEYQLNRRNKFSLSGTFAQLAPQPYLLFIQPEYANLTTSTPRSSTYGGLSANYEFHRTKLHLTAAVFYNWSSNATDITRYYDDLSHTYTHGIVSEISTSSIGVETALTMPINRLLRFENTLCIGRYLYSNAPLVSLYDDSDLTLYSQSRATAIDGCALPESARLYTTSKITFSPGSGWMISAQLGVGVGRYVDPSFARRTDRVVGSGLTDEVVEQERLSNMYDLSIAVMRTFYLNRGSLTLYLRLDNALGDKSLEQQGREANRALYSAGGSTTGMRYLQPNSYSYALPRRLYISCTYNF